jgi:ATP-dependent Lhr-like helicase
VSFRSFHPIVQHWFTAEVGVPTSAQLRGWDSIKRGHHTLIAAPTGSGKTLAAFLSALDELFQDGLRGELRDEVRVVYVSPLKALSADIHKNLSEPRSAIHVNAASAGLSAPHISAAVRIGDTTQSERAAMLRTPPHLLVTTPESLYLLLTADRSRQMLRSVQTVIVDEIHAVIGTRRGAHLALSLERLQHLTGRPLQRIGLSATQKPIEEVARFLLGTSGGDCTIVDEGHRRQMDLGVEIPRSFLDAVMSQEVWEEYYDRLQALIEAHRTTLVFVNTRRLAERLARHLSERLGEDAVTAHHGSLSKETRLEAENRLKTGKLRALVATASLELGIDVGHVDLVCQIGSPHRIATLLQRVGRSGHTLAGTPKGRLFPVSREDLVESAALLRSVRRGELDAIVQHDAPLDVLAQQVVAEASSRDCGEDELFVMALRAWPYRNLTRAEFDSVVKMAAEGFSTRRGRRAALLHRDEINGRVRGRRGARLLAQMSGGAIPEVADYRVVLEPGDTFIGTVNEDFAIESMVGDVFQLGNSSWRVLQVAAGTVRVADARGTPPNIPFWFGEAPARSDELSRAVSDLRADVDARFVEAGSVEARSVEAGFSRPDAERPAEADKRPAEAGLYLTEWLVQETGIPAGAAEQLAAYFAEGRRLLGVIPTQETLVLERFFDEAGGMQLVLHAPFGSRINKAWGLALRKRFCRQFNFELQAAATEDAILLSLGPQHSFPLADVFRYLHPETTRDVLVQAFLDAPVFQTRWRWNATISLAVPRYRGGRKLAPQIQRMLADDLMASVFPDAAACLENIPGDREIPDHPLVNQTIRDCLQEAMDFDGFTAVLRSIHDGKMRLVARDTPEPSVFAHEILNARPYAFLDDAPLEERRAHAVQSRRAGEPSSGRDLGALDPAAIDRVREEARAEPRDVDELHDALMTSGYLTPSELRAVPPAFVETLLQTGRATYARKLLVAVERIPEISAIMPGDSFHPPVHAPASRIARVWTRAEAIVEMFRGRLTVEGPVTAAALAESLDIPAAEADAAMLALEGEGIVLRGRFTPGAETTEWCDRALLSRIHRYTLNRLRAEIEPVSGADYMRFLFRWQHVEPSSRLAGPDGLRELVIQLDGFELAAGAWERSVLPARLDGYEPAMLDMLCLAGEIGWARLSAPAPTPGNIPRLVPATPVALFLREHGEAWRRASHTDTPRDALLTDDARRVRETLTSRGASFFAELRTATSLDDDRLRSAIGVLVACGLAVSDGFSGLRALVWASRGRASTDRRATFAGRWTAVPVGSSSAALVDIDLFARTLLRRYGVVFRRLLVRETNAPPWRDLCRAYRRLEARGEIRGGRFVSGMSSEQFALPDAVTMLREVRRSAPDGRVMAIGTSDPLNLAGIVTPGDRVRSAGRNQMVYRDGVPLAVMESDFLRELTAIEPAIAADVSRALARRRMPSLLRT